MPRTRQQPPRAANDQAYGVRGDQVSAQQQMPIPQNAAPSLTPGRPPGGGGAGGTGGGPAVTAAAPPPTGPGGIPADVLAAAVGTQGGTPLTDPTTRPGEPVTSGLSVGAGPGPEALASMFQARRNRVADTLQRLADDLGEPSLQQLADKARNEAGR